jgi:hypothetical protein
MRIVFVKLADDEHRLEIHRADGSTESAELETRSFLVHDLVHYAVEAEAGIADGFWGLLARGITLADLSDRGAPAPDGGMAGRFGPGIALAERLVGPMQSVFHGRLDAALYVENARSAAPETVDAAFVERVEKRMRALWGHWRATRFRSSMELRWPPA